MGKLFSYYSAESEERSRRWQRFLKLAAGWVLALLIALGLQRYAFQSYQVFGQSMQPTLHEGDYLIISKLAISWNGLKNSDYVPDRGDIIVLDSPVDGSRLIKRVIALPGERVSVSNGSVKVYNQVEARGFDPYQRLGLAPVYASGRLNQVVPQDRVFVIGDNRASGGSLDSRNELGPVPLERIVGRLVLRLWPLGQVKSF